MTDGPAPQRRRTAGGFPCSVKFGDAGPGPLPSVSDIVTNISDRFEIDPDDLSENTEFKVFADSYSRDCANRIGEEQPHVSVAFGPRGYTLLVATPSDNASEISEWCDTNKQQLAAPMSLNKLKGSKHNFRAGLISPDKELIEIDITFAGGSCMSAWFRNYVSLFEFGFEDSDLAEALVALSEVDLIDLRRTHYSRSRLPRERVKKCFQMQVMGTATEMEVIQISSNFQLYQAMRLVANAVKRNKLTQVELKEEYKFDENERWLAEFRCGLSELSALVREESNVGSVIHCFKQFIMAEPFRAIIQSVLDFPIQVDNVSLIGSDAVVFCLDNPATEEILRQLKRRAELAAADTFKNFRAMGIEYIAFKGIDNVRGNVVFSSELVSAPVPICACQSDYKIAVLGISNPIQVSVERVIPKVDNEELSCRFSVGSIFNDTQSTLNSQNEADAQVAVTAQWPATPSLEDTQSEYEPFNWENPQDEVEYHSDHFEPIQEHEWPIDKEICFDEPPKFSSGFYSSIEPEEPVNVSRILFDMARGTCAGLPPSFDAIELKAKKRILLVMILPEMFRIFLETCFVRLMKIDGNRYRMTSWPLKIDDKKSGVSFMELTFFVESPLLRPYGAIKASVFENQASARPAQEICMANCVDKFCQQLKTDGMIDACADNAEFPFIESKVIESAIERSMCVGHCLRAQSPGSQDWNVSSRSFGPSTKGFGNTIISGVEPSHPGGEVKSIALYTNVEVEHNPEGIVVGEAVVGKGTIEPFGEFSSSFIRAVVIKPELINSQTTKITELIVAAASVRAKSSDTKAAMYHVVKIMWTFAPGLFRLFLTQVLNVAIPSDVILVVNIRVADDIDRLPYSFVLFICTMLAKIDIIGMGPTKKIQPQVCIFVGISGSGKSTITNLISEVFGGKNSPSSSENIRENEPIYDLALDYMNGMCDWPPFMVMPDNQTKKSGVLPEEVLLEMIGNDAKPGGITKTFNKKNEPVFLAKTPANHIVITSNCVPDHLGDKDGDRAVSARRMMTIFWPSRVHGKKQVNIEMDELHDLYEKKESFEKDVSREISNDFDQTDLDLPVTHAVLKVTARLANAINLSSAKDFNDGWELTDEYHRMVNATDNLKLSKDELTKALKDVWAQRADDVGLGDIVADCVSTNTFYAKCSDNNVLKTICFTPTDLVKRVNACLNAETITVDDLSQVVTTTNVFRCKHCRIGLFGYAEAKLVQFLRNNPNELPACLENPAGNGKHEWSSTKSMFLKKLA